ncbi:hypothetical protein DFR49_3366 [Hephaestia caeni]|uniref:Uncharacterized protein n=1 Tax=Hephaestia caeni TaxID=645617 RepID=A0A397NVQ9_9SPHN|nr:hypothetical protein [Hephaestia caeni]RIA37481.1 hypothetical protein DFR49_3366 [Hephaestia caeni]
MKDIHSGMALVSVIGAAVVSASTTPAAIDLQGYNAAEIVLAVGAGGITFSGTNKIEFVLTHSDDDDTYVAVDASDVLGAVDVGEGGVIKALTSAHADPTVHRFGYKGGRRYLKLLAKFSGTHGTGTPIAALAILGHGYSQPEADQA